MKAEKKIKQDKDYGVDNYRKNECMQKIEKSNTGKEDNIVVRREGVVT